MKKMKKFASLLLALVMVLSMTVTAFAEVETGTITIDGAVKGQTYTIYEILKLESYNIENTATGDGQYAYIATSSWKNFIESSTIRGTYVIVDGQGYVTWKEGASAADFAKAAQKYATDNGIENQGSQTAGDDPVVFSNLELGYYLVDSTLGTLCALDTTNPDVEIKEKNEAPENEKTVEEDSTTKYGEKNDADIGQTVNFRSVIDAKSGAQNYVFHDTMSEGLTFGSVTSIKLDGNEVDEKYYEIAVENLHDEDCTFEIRFKQDFCDTLVDGAEIVILYTATLNENAVVAGEGNPNTSKLSYGEENHTQWTPDSTTKTYTWDFDVFKYAKNGDVDKPLEGATFTLSKKSDGSEPIALVKKEDNTYRVATADDEDADKVSQITTDNTGKFTIEGLDADTYYLTETDSPAGYNKLSGPVTITIDNEGNTKVNSAIVDEVKVLNSSGSELPSTGGIGTTIFYAAGIILMAGAVFFVVRRKRAN